MSVTPITPGALGGPDDTRQWVRVSVDLYTNPKFMAMSDPTAAIAAYVVSLCMSAQSFSDGVFPLAMVQRLTGISDTVLKEMIAEGLWHDEHSSCERCVIPRRGHGYVHDYLKHQRSGAAVKDLRSKRAAAGRAGAQKRWGQNPATKAPKKATVKAAKATDEQPTDVVLDPKKAELLADAKRLADYLANWVQRNHSKNERPDVNQAWINDMRKLMEIDGHTLDQLRDVIKWTQEHPFWNDKIRSPFKLRKQIKGENDLIGKMQRERSGVVETGAASRAGQALSVADRLDQKYGGQQPIPEIEA